MGADLVDGIQPAVELLDLLSPTLFNTFRTDCIQIPKIVNFVVIPEFKLRILHPFAATATPTAFNHFYGFSTQEPQHIFGKAQ